jgi:hypothetical protein
MMRLLKPQQENIMPILEQLKVTDVSPQTRASRVDRFRRRLIGAIDLQIEIAKADAAGQTLNLTRKRRVKDKTTGRKELKDAPLQVRRWWWRDEGGTVHLALKSGMKTLELAPGRSAIEVGGIEELPAKLALVRDAVRAGELDRCAAAAKIDVKTAAQPSKPAPAQSAGGAKKTAAKR